MSASLVRPLIPSSQVLWYWLARVLTSVGCIRLYQWDSWGRGRTFCTLHAVITVTKLPATTSTFIHFSHFSKLSIEPARLKRHAHSKNATVLISMLTLGRASGGLVGSSNDVCGTKRARPSVFESKHLISNASSGCMRGK